MVKARVTRVVVRQQVVMVGCILAAPDATVAVLAFVVYRVAKAL